MTARRLGRMSPMADALERSTTICSRASGSWQTFGPHNRPCSNPLMHCSAPAAAIALARSTSGKSDTPEHSVSCLCVCMLRRLH